MTRLRSRPAAGIGDTSAGEMPGAMALPLVSQTRSQPWPRTAGVGSAGWPPTRARGRGMSGFTSIPGELRTRRTVKR